MPRKNKGISDFVREEGNIQAPNPEVEIARLVAEADRRGIPSKYLKTPFYRLRKAAGIGRKKKPPVVAVPPQPEAQASPVSEKSPREKLDEALGTIREIVGATLSNCDQTRAELEALRVENQTLKTSLETSRKTLEGQALREMQELAMSIPSHPAILLAVMEAKSKVAIREEGPPGTLPRESKVEGVPMKYREPFLLEYAKLAKGERRQVAKSLRNLAEQGNQYPALESKKLPHSLAGTPAGSWWCRGSREIRFTWNREMDHGTSVAIVVGDLVRRGDTRLGYKEA